MLRKLLRLALVMFLAATVPVQALAALSIDVCKAVEHFDGQAQTVDMGHGHASFEAATDDEQQPIDEAPNHGASCGIAAAIVASATSLAADAPSDGIQATLLPTPEGFVPDRLERPPLNLSL